MFFQNVNSTPIWVLMVFSAVSCFGWPKIKKFVSRYTDDGDKQNFFTLILMIATGAVVVTLSVIVCP